MGETLLAVMKFKAGQIVNPTITEATCIAANFLTSIKSFDNGKEND